MPVFDRYRALAQPGFKPMYPPTFLKRTVTVAAVTLSACIGAYIAMPGAAMAEGLPELGDASDAVLSAPQERAIGEFCPCVWPLRW